MIAAALLLICLPLDFAATAPAEAAAAARLAELRARFTTRPKAESIAELRQLADAVAGTAAAARALDWLGDLAAFEHDAAAARRYYERAYAMAPSGEAHLLAARGLGDLARADGHYRAAMRWYRQASAGASPVLAAELEQKRLLSDKLLKRGSGEWACWVLIGGTLAFFLWRGRVWSRRRELELPLEALYVLPVYALLILGCIGRDAAVLHALVLCAGWSTALIAGAGLAGRAAVHRRWLHLTLLVVANAALFYAACNRAGLLDHLFFTITVG